MFLKPDASLLLSTITAFDAETVPAVIPSTKFNSAAVEVTPSKIFNSAVVTVAPSSISSSASVIVALPIVKLVETVKSPSCVNLIFSVAASELPNLNTISVWLLSAAKVLSASATIDAATVIASVPLLSFGAWNCNAPSTLPSVTAVADVCNVNKAPSPVFMVTSSVNSSDPVSICATAAPDPAPSAYTIAVLPLPTVTVAPLPCLIIIDWLPEVLLNTKYNLSWSLGDIVTVFVELNVPPKTNTLKWPSDNAPSVVVSVCVVPDKVIEPTPFIALSRISKFVLVVAPQVPACSPVPIFSMPLFAVYELAIYNS